MLDTFASSMAVMFFPLKRNNLLEACPPNACHSGHAPSHPNSRWPVMEAMAPPLRSSWPSSMARPFQPFTWRQMHRKKPLGFEGKKSLPSVGGIAGFACAPDKNRVFKSTSHQSKPSSRGRLMRGTSCRTKPKNRSEGSGQRNAQPWLKSRSELGGLGV